MFNIKKKIKFENIVYNILRNMSQEEKFKNLFESTADEIFYDFIRKHNKKIIGVIIFIILLIITVTVKYSQNQKKNYEISCGIHKVINMVKKGENPNNLIDELIVETKTSKIVNILKLDRNKISYRATLLLLKDISKFSKKEFEAYVKQVEELPYVCQYIATIEHFKRFSFTSELLFFKVIENMYKHDYEEKHILTFFMKKKLHASILKGYMYAYVGIINKNPYILSDLISGYNFLETTSLQNVPEIFLSLVNTKSTYMEKNPQIKEKIKGIHEK